MKKTYKIVEPDEYYVPQAARRVSPIRRLFRKMAGGDQTSLRRNLLMLGVPIVASLLVVSVFATQILLDNSAKADIIFEIPPELDQLSENDALNRGLDDSLDAVIEEVKLEEPTEEPTEAPTVEPTPEPTAKVEAVALALMAEPTPTPEPVAAFVEYDRYTIGEVNLRQAASANSESIIQLLPNTTVRVTGISGDWSAVRLQSGRTGYIRSDLLSASFVNVQATTAPPQAQTQAPTTPQTQAPPTSDSNTVTPPASTVSGRLYVKPEYGRIRSGAGTEYAEIGFALRGHTVDVLQDFGEWVQIQTTEGGLVGYMAKELLSSEPIDRVVSYIETNKNMYINVSFAYLRSGPSVDSNAAGSAVKDELVTQISTDGSWSYVYTLGGQMGYIRNDLLTDVVPENPIITPPTTAPPTSPPTTAPPAGDAGFWATNATVYVNTAAANIRLYADVNSERQAVVYFGNALTQVSTNGTWSKVTTSGGVTGYISNGLISETAPSTSGPTEGSTAPPASTWEARDRYIWVFVSAANLRADASADTALVATVTRGTRLRQLFTNGTWSKVRTDSGTEAYILNSLFQLDEIVVTPPTTPPVSDGNAGKRQTVVNVAIAQVGKPYVFASANPNIGFDCSGLVVYAYQQAGYGYLAHGATPQGNNYGSAVYGGMGNWLPGDLLFFGANGYYTHVGIYIGGGQMVHAPSPGYSVTIVNMSNYPRTPAVVKRLFP